MIIYQYSVNKYKSESTSEPILHYSNYEQSRLKNEIKLLYHMLFVNSNEFLHVSESPVMKTSYTTVGPVIEQRNI